MNGLLRQYRPEMALTVRQIGAREPGFSEGCEQPSRARLVGGWHVPILIAPIPRRPINIDRKPDGVGLFCD
jgi:hypothetical protein